MTPRASNSDFRCIHCGNYISAVHAVCGVNNRNHCPYCLWSCHLDLFNAGDRLSVCKAPMRPFGLTTKPGRNKYTLTGGELMLVHLCMDCGRLSINRIAADDDPQTLMAIFSDSSTIPAVTRTLLFTSGIHLLEDGEAWIVQRQLLGVSAISI